VRVWGSGGVGGAVSNQESSGASARKRGNGVHRGREGRPQRRGPPVDSVAIEVVLAIRSIEADFLSPAPLLHSVCKVLTSTVFEV
jgi:hypothetical protein